MKNKSKNAASSIANINTTEMAAFLLSNLVCLSTIAATIASSSSSSSSTEVRLVSIVGSALELSCPSSYPPPWTKTAASGGEMAIIGVNGQRHANWKDPRYEFAAEDSRDSEDLRNFVLRISEIRSSDAGRFVCGSDSPSTFIVTVLR